MVNKSSKEKPTLIFIHGILESSWTFYKWKEKVRLLGYKALFPDLPFKEGPAAVSSIDIYIDFVKDLVKKNSKGPKSVVLVGHSLGGLIAQVIATDVDSRGYIKSVVCLNSAPPAGIFLLDKWTFRLLFMHPITYVWKIFVKKLITINKDDARRLFFNRLSEHEAEEAYGKLHKEPGIIARDIFMQKVKINPKALRSPVLVIGSYSDRITPWDMQKEISKFYGKRAKSKRFDGGHMLTIEKHSEKILDYIIEFIES